MKLFFLSRIKPVPFPALLKHLFLVGLLNLLSGHLHAQDTGILTGKVTSTDSLPLDKASVTIERTDLGTTTAADGKFEFHLPPGEYRAWIRIVGYQPHRKSIVISSGKVTHIDVILQEDRLNLNEVVVSATRYGVDRREAPVIVNVISPKIFNATQSVAMSETLNYQPGVRVETNCQNCGFTQVRLNGLGGAYSQILINSRPVFSALSSVYGLDQIPTSMVDRIEVVRSGGSALFGSNAIAGTINVITKDPVENTWQIGSTNALVDGSKWDNTVDFNASIISEDLATGVTFYGMNRNRQAFDANGDGFTEMTKLKNTTFGGKAFYMPSDVNRITLDFSVINEFRRGGDRLDLAPHFTDITEQLDYSTFLGGLTFDHYSTDYRNKFSVYTSAQKGKRNSFYGGLGGNRTPADSLLASNAYGHTDDLAWVGGLQFTHNFANDVLTAGAEHQLNDTQDEIAGYARLVDQTSNSTGLYAQYEWKPVSAFTALVGARYDYVTINGRYTLRDINRIGDVRTGVLSPRLTLLYNITDDLQFRGGYARGFRAPQAFNEDMHVSSVGGQQVFVLISDNLKTEYSNAYTASLNLMKNVGNTQFSALVEGFYTDLRNPFTNVLSTELAGVLLEEMRNGAGAYVTGTNIELSMAPSARYSLQAGGTVQRSRYREAQVLFDGTAELPAVTTDEFVKSPNVYGYISSNWKATEQLSVDVTGTYTGSMIAPHVVNDNAFILLKNTPEFFELNMRLGYVFKIKTDFSIELSGGVQNLLNSYQKDFDMGPARDSDYIYGPARPRTYFLGLKIGHFH
ncbi:TonB-dependent receptor [Parapedobacter lycopersici]|uniref:TonB-dependent receptor n=1 Tax=Parapedobacter lycopersici TaxID=1864939 RepID=UPI00214D8773|nr:TonB-dependent receptor [Parapedobacter lycopersici]